MGIFDPFKKKQPPVEQPNEDDKRINNAAWPFCPERHAEDRHFMMNEYTTFGIYSFIGTETENGELTAVNYYVSVLMENSYGERYASIIKNGVVTTETKATTLVRSTPEWKAIIEPWLNNESDYIPMQDGIVNSQLSDKIRRISKAIKSK